MFGDFNKIVSHEEEGGVLRSESLMDAFHCAIDDCGLKDFGYRGSILTWKKGTSLTTFKRERLDRFLADGGWCGLFPSFAIHHFPNYRSDHDCIILSTSNFYERGGVKKAFQFEAWWLSNEECGKVVEDSWVSSVGKDAASRIAMCGESLSSWASKKFGDMKKKIRITEDVLKEIQGRMSDATMFEQYSPNPSRRLYLSYSLMSQHSLPLSFPPMDPTTNSYHPALGVSNIRTLIPLTLDVDKVQYTPWATLFSNTAKAYNVLDHIDSKAAKPKDISTEL
uniref:Endonuclease/exonuclease/phosphatase n=1 Tax=Chenopodium quinoa TaxID=63459 RepID=A0A803MS34_CHEQI